MNRRRHQSGLPVVMLAILVVTSACRKEDAASNAQSQSSGASVAARKTPVIISAAASTKEVTEELAKQFQRETGATVHVNLGGSNALAAQIISGAPADLFLSASPEWATAVADAGLAERMAPLVANTLVIVTPKGNPAAVREPHDLAHGAVRHIALAGETVPAGRYADQALESLNLLVSLTAQRKIVRGQDVRVALSYVERGEAEAGIVYATDAGASKKIEVVYMFDSSAHDPIEYILVTLKRAEENPAAGRFVEFLKSDEAHAVFESHGFRSAGEW